MYNFWGDFIFILVYFSILWRGFYRTIIILIMLAGHELSATNDPTSNSSLWNNCWICQIILTFLLVLTNCIDDIIIIFWFFVLQNSWFQVAEHLFSNRSQMTSQCGKNISDTHLMAPVTLFGSYHILNHLWSIRAGSHTVGIRSARSVTIQCKLKRGIGSGVRSTMESESEGSEEFLFLLIPLPLPLLPSCRFTLDQNFLLIPTPLTTPLPSLPWLVWTSP